MYHLKTKDSDGSAPAGASSWGTYTNEELQKFTITIDWFTSQIKGVGADGGSFLICVFASWRYAWLHKMSVCIQNIFTLT